VRVSASRVDGAWWFAVEDNGIGMDPSDAEEIFEPFHRLHGEGSYPGTGIGLAVCERIVEQHGGRIWAESEPGRGSTFRFTLPADGQSIARTPEHDESAVA
jgi:signal transduction histidine kinase